MDVKWRMTSSEAGQGPHNVCLVVLGAGGKDRNKRAAVMMFVLFCLKRLWLSGLINLVLDPWMCLSQRMSAIAR